MPTAEYFEVKCFLSAVKKYGDDKLSSYIHIRRVFISVITYPLYLSKAICTLCSLF